MQLDLAVQRRKRVAHDVETQPQAGDRAGVGCTVRDDTTPVILQGDEQHIARVRRPQDQLPGLGLAQRAPFPGRLDAVIGGIAQQLHERVAQRGEPGRRQPRGMPLDAQADPAPEQCRAIIEHTLKAGDEVAEPGGSGCPGRLWQADDPDAQELDPHGQSGRLDGQRRG